jgi:PKD repeat protein
VLPKKKAMKTKRVLTLVLLTLCVNLLKLQAQTPASSFSINQSTGCVGQTFTLTDLSTESPTAWQYVIGTETLTAQDPVYTFTAAGVYTVELTAFNGLGAGSLFSSTVEINANPSLTITAPAQACMGDQVTLTCSGATTYSWTGGLTNGLAFTATASSLYSVSASDANGCEAQDTYSLVVNNLPALSVSGPTLLCKGATASYTASGADTYSWNSVSATAIETYTVVNSFNFTITGSDALTGCETQLVRSVSVVPTASINANSGAICTGATFTIQPNGASTYSYSSGTALVAPTSDASYTVTGTDQYGCSAKEVVVSVTVNAIPTLTVNNGSTCAGSSFTLSANGASSYTYSSGNAVVSPNGTTTYSIMGTDANGCVSANTPVTVSVSLLPIVSANGASICAGESVTLSPNGAATYTFSSGNSVVTPNSTTTYTIAGTDAAGCISLNTAVTVTVYSAPTINVSGGAVCVGQTFTLTPNGALTYTYSSGNAVVTPNSTTTYTVLGTDAAGCVSLNTPVTVTVNSLPSITISDAAICLGQSYTLTPNGALTYTFSSGSAVVTPNSTTTYTVAGTDAAGCVSLNAPVTVTVNSLPSVNVNGGAICLGQSFTMSPNGAISYTYSSGSAIVSPQATTSYSVYGADANGCESAVAIATIVVNALPVVSAANGTICIGNSFQIVPNGAVTYTISGGSLNVNPSTTTVYQLTGTDANGCESAVMVPVQVLVNPLPLVGVQSLTTAICAGQTLTLTATGAVNYTWTGLGNTTAVVVSPANTTTYNVTGSDANACSNTSNFILQVYALPQVNVQTSAQVICAGESLTLTGVGANSYVWTTGATSNQISFVAVSNTVISVVGTSSLGCSNTAAYTQTVSDCTGITELHAQKNQFVVFPNPGKELLSLQSQESGTAFIFAGNGQMVQQIEISAGTTPVDASQLSNGIYIIQVQSASGVQNLKWVKQN